MNHCLRHFEEPPAGTCRTCKQPFCTRCLVWALGPKKPPFCVACALSASGVRPSHRTVIGDGAEIPVAAGADAPALDKRIARAERRAEREARKRAERAERRNGRRGGKKGSEGGGSELSDDRVADLGAGSAPDSRVPAPSQLAAALRTAAVPRGLMGAD